MAGRRSELNSSAFELPKSHRSNWPSGVRNGLAMSRQVTFEIETLSE